LFIFDIIRYIQFVVKNWKEEIFMVEEVSAKSKKRAYHSPTRQRQTEETRHKMLAASRRLFLQLGYAGTTTEAIAEEAGVSPRTVLAAFGSKRGILAELLSLNSFGERYQELLMQLRVEPDPFQRVKVVAQLTRQIYETSTPEFDLLRGAGAIAPELADFYRDVEEHRWGLQERFITFLETCDMLRADLSHAKASDELWALTSFDLYRRLIIERGWSTEEYETWLVRTLIQQLFQS
jgi:AcrR family transcriptional regulator